MATTSDHTLIAFRNDIYLKFEKKVIKKKNNISLDIYEKQKTARKNKTKILQIFLPFTPFYSTGI